MGALKSKPNSPTAIDHIVDSTNPTVESSVNNTVIMAKPSTNTLKSGLVRIQKYQYFRSLRLSKRRPNRANSVGRNKNKDSTITTAVSKDPNTVTAIPEVTELTATTTTTTTPEKPLGSPRRLIKSKSQSDIQNMKLDFEPDFLPKRLKNNDEPQLNKLERPNSKAKAITVVAPKAQVNSNDNSLKSVVAQSLTHTTNSIQNDTASNYTTEDDNLNGSGTYDNCPNDVDADIDDVEEEEEEDDEWNRQNDTLIDELKKQIETMTRQLDNIGKEDSKIINDLSTKIENLAKMNNTIITSIQSESKRREEQNVLNQQQRQFQQKRMLEEYYKRINQQNEILLKQQNQIEQMRNVLYNSVNVPSSNSEETIGGYYEQHGAYAYYTTPTTKNQYVRASNGPTAASYSYYPTYDNPPAYKPHTSRGYNYNSYDRRRQYQHQQEQAKYRRAKETPKIYYDSSTGCYYYHEIVPTTTATPVNVAPPASAYYYDSSNRHHQQRPRNHQPQYHYQQSAQPSYRNYSYSHNPTQPPQRYYQQRHQPQSQQPPVYVYTEYHEHIVDDTDRNNDNMPSGVIITEIDDDEDITELNRK